MFSLTEKQLSELIYTDGYVKVDDYLTIDSWFDDEEGFKVIDLVFTDQFHIKDKDVSFILNDMDSCSLENRIKEEYDFFYLTCVRVFKD